ncbi:hypothetical protein AB1Y20_005792 [Prymnesium parvum]|uniref:EF-hand domain-containing protein n=1 Tax=Prymnesium parvum TaxID=97485 RepID=A0AB34J3Z9_PRYPA
MALFPSSRAALALAITMLAPALAALLDGVAPKASGFRSKFAELTTLLPKGGPGLMEFEDAHVSKQAPGAAPDAVLTPAQAIKGLYRAFNARDADRVASFLTEDCVYEDLLLGPSTVCRGREAFVNALRFHPAFVSNKLFKDSPFGSLFPDVVIEVDSIAEGVDTVGVEWHVQVKRDDGKEFPFPLGRGLSQAKVCVETGKIERVVDIAEAPWRIIGVALLPLIQVAQLLISPFTPKNQPVSSEQFAPDMVAALFKAIDADGSGYLDMQEIELAAEKLGFPFESQDDLEAFFSRFDSRGDGRISEADFSAALAVLEAQDE